jgi:hypothetical protein
VSKLQKYGIIGLSLALLLPMILNYSHVFTHEFKFGCDNNNITHLHQSTIDCELCKFHPTPLIVLELFNFDLNKPPLKNRNFYNHYEFLSDFQKLSFDLRGPPFS